MRSIETLRAALVPSLGLIVFLTIMSADCAAQNQPDTGSSPPLSKLRGAQKPFEKPPDTPKIFDRLVLYEDKETKVETAYGTVVCAPNSVAYVCHHPHRSRLAVYTLDSNKKDDVRVLIKDQTINVAPGREVVITTEQDVTFKDVAPKNGILYRKPLAAERVGNVQVFRAEFLIDSAAERIPEIRNLAESKDPEDRKKLDHILKNAARLQSNAGRQYLEHMRLPVNASLVDQSGVDQSRGQALHQSDPASSAPQELLSGFFLQGKVDLLESLKGRAIDVTVAQPPEKSAPSDKDIH